MKITVEHYDSKHTIEIDRNDLSYAEFMEIIEKISYSMGYPHTVIKMWFEEQ